MHIMSPLWWDLNLYIYIHILYLTCKLISKERVDVNQDGPSLIIEAPPPPLQAPIDKDVLPIMSIKLNADLICLPNKAEKIIGIFCAEFLKIIHVNKLWHFEVIYKVSHYEY